MLLKLMNDDELKFKFTFNIRRKEDGSMPIDTVINGLTFVVAPNQRVLDSLVTREFHADPNLHKNPNVNLVGDFSTDGSSAVQFEWNWAWKPPNGNSDGANFGWRNACSVSSDDLSIGRECSSLTFCSLWNMIGVRTNYPRWQPSPFGYRVSSHSRRHLFNC